MKNRITSGIPRVISCENNVMIVDSESRDAASSMKSSLLGPNTTLNIGAWNVRTMYQCSKTAQVVKEMNIM